MNSFALAPQLKQDTFFVTIINNCQLLVMNSKEVPWLILVPQTTKKELTNLPMAEQIKILETINQLSKFIENNYAIQKLNIASIGNVVSQLHLHIVGRYQSDSCFPKPVWGNIQHQPYHESDKQLLIKKLLEHLS